jgi:DNA-directed RNA polymerase sigma subunit (sigma70/sigma32)
MTKDTLHSSAETLGQAADPLDEQTEKVLTTLAPREEMVLRMRFGIGHKASTLEELSQQFLLPRDLLRRIEVQALRKVRERTRAIYPRASFAACDTGGPSTNTSL